MKQSLYLLKFNNYYNRMVKGYDGIDGYADYILDRMSQINFVENDNITTSIAWNSGYMVDVHTADYLIVCDIYNDIISRWFITEIKKQSNGQFILFLSRDVVYDYKNIIVEAPCFIEKATLGADNPLIYNQEDFITNQIKNSEFLLKDKSDCAWLVGYLDASQSINNIIVKKDLGINTTLIGGLTSWEWYQYTNLAAARTDYANSFTDKLAFYIYVYEVQNDALYQLDLFPLQRSYKVSIKFTIPAIINEGKPIAARINTPVAEFAKLFAAEFFNIDFTSWYPEILPNYIGDVNDLEGILVEDDEAKIYSVSVTEAGYTSGIQKDSLSNGIVETAIKYLVSNITGVPQTRIGTRYAGPARTYNITLTYQSAYNFNFNLSTTKMVTEDIYRMVCIPYPDEGKAFEVTGALTDEGLAAGDIRVDRDIALLIANAIIKAAGGVSGSSLVYDFQVLPFCPIYNNYIWSTYLGQPSINIGGMTPVDGHYTAVGEGLGIVFEVVNPRFSFNIEHSIKVKDPKVENQLDMYRLCSPNYAAMFEFNAAKNGGVNYFNVDCHYKPYQPYIHINPDFGNLYGRDFDDPRGLILSGDFSLGSTSDAFKTYELQNKNYQSMFDRQIQNIETQNKYEKIREQVSAVTGIVSGMSSGAVSGAMVSGGNPYAAAAGAVVGGGAALVGGIADRQVNEVLRNEALDYTKDMFGFNLENIKALPNTLTKVSAINPNNKIYPVLEFYTCTDREREAFKNKIKYNGMTVGVIDKISNYLQVEPTYIKGKIIRLEDLEANFYIANVIANEINKGVFI